MTNRLTPEALAALRAWAVNACSESPEAHNEGMDSLIDWVNGPEVLTLVDEVLALRQRVATNEQGAIARKDMHIWREMVRERDVTLARVQELERERDELREKLKQVEVERDAFAADRQSDREDRNHWKNEAQTYREALAELREELKQLESDHATRKHYCRNVEAERDELREKLQQAEEERDKLKQDMHLAVSNAGKDLIAERDRLVRSNGEHLAIRLERTQELDALREAVRAAHEALSFYAHEDHYESMQTLSGLRPPGVLVERGQRARQALSALAPHVGRKGSDELR